jgi:neutral ceramidase
LRILSARRALAALVLAASIPALVVGVASLPWHADLPDAPMRTVRAMGGTGALRAGAGAVGFALPEGVPIGGFARLSYRSEGLRDPVGARALVLSTPGLKIALASAELLLIPEALREAVAARVADLELSGILLAATHTHSGPGGYWNHLVGERVATGPYDERVLEAVAAAIAEAIRRADAESAPALVSVARGTAGALARSRSGGGRDGRVAVVRFERPGGAPVAELAIFPAHPTILGRENRRISGDWPGSFLAGGDRGVRLFFQGALGDQSVEGPTTTPEAFGSALSAEVAALEAGPLDASPALAYAAVEVSLPALAPGAAPALLHRAARNLGRRAFPATARVEAVRIGPLLLVAIPAEPVAAVAAAWRAALPPDAEIVSLAGGYLGYVEEPERMAASAGETARTYFGADLGRRLGEAAIAAAGEADASAAATSSR